MPTLLPRMHTVEKLSIPQCKGLHLLSPSLLCPSVDRKCFLSARQRPLRNRRPLRYLLCLAPGPPSLAQASGMASKAIPGTRLCVCPPGVCSRHLLAIRVEGRKRSTRWGFHEKWRSFLSFVFTEKRGTSARDYMGVRVRREKTVH